MYHYRNGEKVEIGDIVRVWHGHGWMLAVVKMIIRPDSKHSIHYGCPKGGILVEEDWNGEPNPILETPDSLVNEDYQLVVRRKKYP